MRIWPEFAGKGRYFNFGCKSIPASVDFVKESPLCTTICKDGYSIRTVEHLLSALEAKGVDNCKIEINNLNSDSQEVEVGAIALELYSDVKEVDEIFSHCVFVMV